MNQNRKSLLEVLSRAQSVGFLGPGDLSSHIDHATRFERGIPVGCAELLDLGSGGGVPALPLLLSRPDMRALLVDTSQRRCSFLVWAACELGIQDRVSVKRARAEELAHDRSFRGAYPCVTARSFGPPAWTLECALGFLAAGGRFVVSEPPGDRMWPTESGLVALGLSEVGPFDGIACFERNGPIPEEVPRKAKIASAAPLFAAE